MRSGKNDLVKGFRPYLERYGKLTEIQIPFYVSWVSAAYQYAGEARHVLLKNKAESAFLHETSKKYENWQVKQARHALSLYRHYLETERGNNKNNSADSKTDTKDADSSQFDHIWRDYAEKVRESLRLQQKSYRTEQTYLRWISRFYRFLQGGDPRRLSADDARRFLSHLTVEEDVASSTQNQALNALLYFYRNALDRELGDVGQAVRAPKKERLPVVLSQNEMQRVLNNLDGEGYVMAALSYGAGLRLSECLRLRIHDIDLDRGVLTVRGGKQDKDRQTVLPADITEPIKEQMKVARAVYEQDRKDNVAGVHLPKALARKYNNAGKEWQWFWLFPSEELSVDPRTKLVRRHHLSRATFQRHIKDAARSADIPKRVTVHTLRHSFATHLIEKGYDIRTVQELLGHNDVRNTMVYTHVAKRNVLGVQSPLDE